MSHSASRSRPLAAASAHAKHATTYVLANSRLQHFFQPPVCRISVEALSHNATTSTEAGAAEVV